MAEFDTEPRKGMPSPELDEATFRQRFLARFIDPAFAPLSAELDRIASAAWDAYSHSRKAPRTRPAGPGYADPSYELSADWIAAKAAVEAAQARHDDPNGPCRALLINGSSRSEHTCPGEMSKSYRLAEIAREALETDGIAVELLDLSRLASEYGRQIHPCKACFSTAPALCHWPCSCYPNYALGQTDDWMNEIYPMWVEAHGIMIITPVNWYQVSSPVKLMMDRLVCADGGNPDPTTTDGKDPAKAKAIELKGWDYPRHLAGRAFSVVVHGDAAGVETLRRILTDWLEDIGLIASGHKSHIGAYIGYLGTYAESHKDLDKDKDVQADVKTAAQALVNAVKLLREGKLTPPDADLHEARPK